MTIKLKPNASKWVKERVKQWGPFVEIRRDDCHILVRGLTHKPNGEAWVGWLPFAEVEVK